MTNKEAQEFAVCFSAYLEELRGSNDSGQVANTATEMVKHLIQIFPKIKQELMDVEPEVLTSLGII